MKVVWTLKGSHYPDALVVLLSPHREPGELSETETAELFGGQPEAENWRGKPLGALELTPLSCAVRGGRHPELGELWLFERVK